MKVPAHPKIYHIVHVDRLPSIIAAGRLWCDAEVLRRGLAGTGIGMSKIKQRRLEECRLASHPDLRVGDCVPFYFCPRSVMLFLIRKANDPDLAYHGGQEPIVHLEADLREAVAWAEGQGLRWAFTLSNAGAYYFEDRADLAQLGKIDWPAVRATDWRDCKEGKQAELLVERQFPWELVDRIGVQTVRVAGQVARALQGVPHRPKVEVLPSWYY